MPKLLFDDHSHLYFLTEENGDWWNIPSVTTLLREMGFGADLTWMRPETLEKARVRGTTIHSYMEEHFNGTLSVEDIDPDYEPYMDSFFGWLEKLDQDGKILSEPKTEMMVWGDYGGLQVAGTIDLICLIDGAPTLIDFKTRDRAYPSDRAQVTAYSDMLGGMYLPHILLVNGKGTPAKLVEVDAQHERWNSVVDSFAYKIELKVERNYDVHPISSDNLRSD